MYNLTEEQLKRLHTAMCDDNEHQCNRLNNYIHTDEYLTAEVVQVVREIVAEATEELQESLDIRTRLNDDTEQYNIRLEAEMRRMRERLREAKHRYDSATDKTPIMACGAEYRLFYAIERMLEDWEASDD